MGQLYKLVVQATGEVRDADGNLISTSPVEMRQTVEEGSEGHILAQAFLNQYNAVTGTTEGE